jgi:sec-independent protein translocase protein TatB
MFDVAFSELVVIGVVALVVIGPERLPKVARTAGILLGRLQRYVNDVKADINREIQLEELKKMQDEVAKQVMSMEHSVTEQLKSVETDLNQSIAAGIGDKAQAAAGTESAAGNPAPPAAEISPPPVAVAATEEKPKA